MKNIYNKTIVVICLSLFIILFSGCNPAPDKYEINFGCGGGFTAKYHSYRIIQDGTVHYCVHAFTSPDYDLEGTIIGKISRKDADKFYSRLSSIGFNDIDYINPDYVSCSLGLKGIGEAHSVTWPLKFNEITPPVQ